MKSPEKPLARGPASIPKVEVTIVLHLGPVNGTRNFRREIRALAVNTQMLPRKANPYVSDV
jgi:hypothetical protein